PPAPHNRAASRPAAPACERRSPARRAIVFPHADASAAQALSTDWACALLISVVECSGGGFGATANPPNGVTPAQAGVHGRLRQTGESDGPRLLSRRKPGSPG